MTSRLWSLIIMCMAPGDWDVIPRVHKHIDLAMLSVETHQRWPMRRLLVLCWLWCIRGLHLSPTGTLKCNAFAHLFMLYHKGESWGVCLRPQHQAECMNHRRHRAWSRFMSVLAEISTLACIKFVWHNGKLLLQKAMAIDINMFEIVWEHIGPILVGVRYLGTLSKGNE